MIQPMLIRPSKTPRKRSFFFHTVKIVNHKRTRVEITPLITPKLMLLSFQTQEVGAIMGFSNMEYKKQTSLCNLFIQHHLKTLRV